MGLKADGVTIRPTFMPNEYVNRAQFGTVFSRLIFGDIFNVKDENNVIRQQPDYRYTKHLVALNQKHIMTKIGTPLMQELR